MSKNYIIAIFAGLLIVSLLTRSCGNKVKEYDTYKLDSLNNAIKLKQDTLQQHQSIIDSLEVELTKLQIQEHEIKIIKVPYPVKDSVYNSYDVLELARAITNHY